MRDHLLPVGAVLEENTDGSTAAVFNDSEVANEAVALERLHDFPLQVGRRSVHRVFAVRHGVADAGKEVSNGIGHAHDAPLGSPAGLADTPGISPMWASFRKQQRQMPNFW
jgi:hypothetical protein